MWKNEKLLVESDIRADELVELLRTPGFAPILRGAASSAGRSGSWPKTDPGPEGLWARSLRWLRSWRVGDRQRARGMHVAKR